MVDIKFGKWLNRLSVLAWMIALIGYFAPWIARDPMSAALAWNAYDLFDLLRLLPEIQSGALRVNLQALRLPLLGLAVTLPLLLANARRPARLAAGLFGVLLAGLTLPPYPQILNAWRTPGWSAVLWWAVGAAVGTLAFAWLAPRLRRYREWWVVGLIALMTAPAGITLHRVLPALSRLHAAPVWAGWGYWTCMVGMGLIGISAWLQAALQGGERENPEGEDGAPSRDQGEVPIATP